MMRIIKTLIVVVFLLSALPSLIWRETTPRWVKAIAMGTLVIGVIVSLVERFGYWNKLSERYRSSSKE